MTSDGTPWFLRHEKYSEPNGDYQANCYMDVLKADSEDSVTFNDHSCKANSNAYYCQPVKKKEAPPLPAEDEEPDMPEPPPPPPPPVTPKSGSTNVGFVCMDGAYTGVNEKCSHFQDISKDECWNKCAKNAHAEDRGGCDKITGFPECVAMVFDGNPKGGMCMLHRECTKIMKVPPPDPNMPAPPPGIEETTYDPEKIVTRLKDGYHPKADIFERFEDKRCRASPYTKPDGDKKGLTDVTEKECADACFANKWVGDKKVPVNKCVAAVYYPSKEYCDLYDECDETKKKTGAILLRKVTDIERQKKEDDNDNEDED
jgi:hypothetical protein